MLIQASVASAIHSRSTKWSTAQVEQRAQLQLPQGLRHRRRAPQSAQLPSTTERLSLNFASGM